MPVSASDTISSSTFPATQTLTSPRKADAGASFIPSEPPRCPKLQHASALPQEVPLGPFRNPRLNTPEAGSILAIMRENYGSRLYVPPLLWTAEHVQLLGFRFLAKELPRIRKLPPKSQLSSDSKDVIKASVTPLDYAAHAAESLSRPCTVNARTAAVGDILAACNFEYTGKSWPSFYFDRDRYSVRLPAPALFKSGSNTPLLAYMNLDTLQPMREEFFYQRKFRSCFYDSRQKQHRINPPVSRLIRKLLRQLQPENEYEDPYIVAVLIALAQEQYFVQKQLSGSGARNAPNSIGLDSQSNPIAATIQAASKVTAS
ncbi:hypothetical protein S40288_08311 [Stachybotrys chartarum IBT 40288]|nr:hypothetical protein S40288_08311 [Stachybotrys chartarum IBT 40288]